MKECTLHILDEVNVKFDGLDTPVRRKMVNKMRFFLPHAKYTPAYKLGRWDGYVNFCDIGGRTYLHLLSDVIPIIQEAGYAIKVVDNRKKFSFSFSEIDLNSYSHIKWPEGHPVEGTPIVLRDYQVKYINTFLSNLQGVATAPTGAGKAHPYYTKVMTSSGWKEIKDIKVGDFVVTPDSELAPVTGVYNRGELSVNTIYFEDGRTAECCDEHLWSVVLSDNTKEVIDTNDIKRRLKTENVYIPLVYHDNAIDKEIYYRGYEASRNLLYVKTDEGIIRYKRYYSFVLGIIHVCGNFVNGRIMIPKKIPINTIKEYLYGAGFVVKETDCAYLLNHSNIHKLREECITDDGSRAEPVNKLKIEKIVRSGKENSICISIDSKEHLYVIKDHIVTHNTICTAVLADKIGNYGRSLLIVPSVDLINQTIEDYHNLGLEVGVYYGKHKEFDKKHTICTWQSLGVLAKKKINDGHTIHDLTNNLAGVIVDECHKAKATVLKQTLSKQLANVPIRWGLTGTIPRQDFEKYTLRAVIGPVLSELTPKELQDKGVLSKLDIEIVQMQDNELFSDYRSELAWLSSNEKRLQAVASLIKEKAKSGNTLILVDKIKTGEMLNEMIPEADFVSGSLKNEARREIYSQVKDSNTQIIIATYGVASTGINIPRIFNLFLFEPGKSFVRVIQSIGRGVRKAKDKDYLKVYDICSNTKYSKRHLAERKKIYRESEYPFEVRKLTY